VVKGGGGGGVDALLLVATGFGLSPLTELRCRLRYSSRDTFFLLGVLFEDPSPSPKIGAITEVC